MKINSKAPSLFKKEIKHNFYYDNVDLIVRRLKYEFSILDLTRMSFNRN